MFGTQSTDRSYRLVVGLFALQDKDCVSPPSPGASTITLLKDLQYTGPYLSFCHSRLAPGSSNSAILFDAAMPAGGSSHSRNRLHVRITFPPEIMNIEYDVCIAGAGNAALCAAISAADKGARVLVLERAPQSENGGNSRFTAGGCRFAYNGVDDLRTLCDLSASEIETSEFGSYTESQFFDDMFRVTEFRCDPDLVEVLIRNSLPTIRWLHDRGVRFVPMYGRQAFKTDGKFRFWGGLSIEARGGGPGLVDTETEIAKQAGVEIRYAAKVTGLLYVGERVEGVIVRENGKIREIRSRSVVLATGGFEANTEMRSR